MSFFTTPEILSVSSITRSIKSLLENEYRFIHVRGEVSNLRRPYSGHLYFTLKDDSAQLKTVCFKGQQKFLERAIEDGQQLVCHGRISIYDQRGEYQLIVDTVDFQGSGHLYETFEKLKVKLGEQGLFDQERKRPMPPFARSIVVITSPSGAAIQDFLKICRQRHTTATISIYPVRVQGEGSAREISQAIDRVNEQLTPDLIVLCRGGGSIEDLWSFNEECVAKAISRSTIPIVTGIGHEIDFTIADFCSDLRAPTPTGAAEQVIVDEDLLRDSIQLLTQRLHRSIVSFLDSSASQVHHLQRLVGNLEPLFTRSSLDLDARFSRFVQAMHNRIMTRQATFDKLHLGLRHQSPGAKLLAHQERLNHLRERLSERINQQVSHKENAYTRQLMLLDAVSPLATLARGYSITRKKDQKDGDYKVINSVEQIAIQDRLEIILHQGKVECEVVRKDATGALPEKNSLQ